MKQKVLRHGKRCQCLPCASARIKAFQARVQNMGRWDPPTSSNVPMVPVRAHWRRQKNYLNKDSVLKDAVLQIMHALAKKRSAS